MSARGPAGAVAVVVLAAAAIAACGSQAGTKGGGRPQAEGRTLQWYLPTDEPVDLSKGDFIPVSHGREPFLPGDSFYTWNILPGGGHQQMYCVISTQEPRSTFWCRRTFVLSKGQIVAAGVYDNAPEGSNPGTIPIVGGTGAYVGARGTLASTGGGRRGLTLTVRLR